MEGGEDGSASPEKAGQRRVGASIGHWAGYGWFMSFGTFLPLAVFLAGYLVRLTIVGAALAQSIERIGIWLSTLGQEPPGKDRLDVRQREGVKRPLAERIRPYSPPGIIERRGRPFSLWQRSVWFVFVGWWLGAIWVVLSWSVLLMPYPFLETVQALLNELPSVMTLAVPEQREGGAVPAAESAGTGSAGTLDRGPALDAD